MNNIVYRAPMTSAHVVTLRASPETWLNIIDLATKERKPSVVRKLGARTPRGKIEEVMLPVKDAEMIEELAVRIP